MVDIELYNKILSYIDENGLMAFALSDTKEEWDAVHRLESENLIYTKSNSVYNLTSLGQEVVDLGGYEHWKEATKKEQEIDDQIKELTLKELKGNVFQLKYWWVILILSGLVGFISGNFELIINWFK